MDPLAALDAAARALDAEDFDEAIDRLFDYYGHQSGRNQTAEALTVRALDMRDRFITARELSAEAETHDKQGA